MNSSMEQTRHGLMDLTLKTFAETGQRRQPDRLRVSAHSTDRLAGKSAEAEGDILATETETIIECVIQFRFAGLIGHVI